MKQNMTDAGNEHVRFDIPQEQEQVVCVEESEETAPLAPFHIKVPSLADSLDDRVESTERKSEEEEPVIEEEAVQSSTVSPLFTPQSPTPSSPPPSALLSPRSPKAPLPSQLMLDEEDYYEDIEDDVVQNALQVHLDDSKRVTMSESDVLRFYKDRLTESDREEERSDSPYISLFVSCRKLTNLDLLTYSDPQAALYVYYEDTTLFHEVGRTNVMLNTLNPDFSQPILFNSNTAMSASTRKKGKRGEESKTFRPLRFVVMDVDTARINRGNADIIGVADLKYTELKAAMDNHIPLIKHLAIRDRKHGKIIIHGERVLYSDLKLILTLGIKYEAPPVKNPYFIVRRKICNAGRSSGSGELSWHPVYISEVLNSSSKQHIFKHIIIYLIDWCAGDLDAVLQITTYDYRSSSRSIPVGRLHIATRQLIDSVLEHRVMKFPLKHSGTFNHPGVLEFFNLRIVEGESGVKQFLKEKKAEQREQKLQEQEDLETEIANANKRCSLM